MLGMAARPRTTLTAALLSLTVAAGAACSGGHREPVSPRPAVLPPLVRDDSPGLRAAKLARYIEARWPRIEVRRATVNPDGTVVTFNDQARFDRSIHDINAYTNHVRTLTGDLAQASVELLQLSLRYFPQMRLATVYQDSGLRAAWTREEIVAMDRPEAYRSYRSFLRLVFTAQYPPLGATPPPPPTS
jgi:hypothetical protein